MARAAVMKALQAAQAGGTSAARWVSVAKAKACAAGGLAAQEGVQMHGGMGMTDEFDMAKVCYETCTFGGSCTLNPNSTCLINKCLCIGGP